MKILAAFVTQISSRTRWHRGHSRTQRDTVGHRGHRDIQGDTVGRRGAQGATGANATLDLKKEKNKDIPHSYNYQAG